MGKTGIQWGQDTRFCFGLKQKVPANRSGSNPKASPD